MVVLAEAQTGATTTVNILDYAKRAPKFTVADSTRLYATLRDSIGSTGTPGTLGVHSKLADCVASY